VELSNKAKEQKDKAQNKKFFHIIGTLRSHEKLKDELFDIQVDNGIKL